MQASYSHLFNDGISPTIVLSSIPFFFVGRAISGKFVPKLIKIFGLKFLNALNILLNLSYYLWNIWYINTYFILLNTVMSGF